MLRSMLLIWLVVLATFFGLILLRNLAKADSYDPVIRFQCVPRAYCGIWGGPLAQQCAYPVIKHYCEREHVSGTIIWWWR